MDHFITENQHLMQTKLNFEKTRFTPCFQTLSKTLPASYLIFGHLRYINILYLHVSINFKYEIICDLKSFAIIVCPE